MLNITSQSTMARAVFDILGKQDYERIDLGQKVGVAVDTWKNT